MNQRAAIVMALSFALFFHAVGCLPFASPPMRAGAGGGGAFGEVVTMRSDQPVESNTNTMFQIRIDLMPMDAFPALIERHWDLGLGYVAEFLDTDSFGGSFRQGPSLSGTLYPLLIDDSGNSGTFLWRLGLNLRAEAMFARLDRGLEVGAGGSLGVSFGFASFTEGPFQSSDMIGVAYGETGLEVYVEGAFRVMYDGPYYLLTAGLMVRVPASVGAMWIR